MQRTKDEIAEIERHKYFLSERMGYDVGWKFAEQDWVDKYADAWRTTPEDTFEPAAAGQQVATVQPATSVATAEPRNNVSTARPAVSGAVGPIKRFFNRVFARN